MSCSKSLFLCLLFVAVVAGAPSRQKRAEGEAEESVYEKLHEYGTTLPKSQKELVFEIFDYISTIRSKMSPEAHKLVEQVEAVASNPDLKTEDIYQQSLQLVNDTPPNVRQELSDLLSW